MRSGLSEASALLIDFHEETIQILVKKKKDERLKNRKMLKDSIL